MKLRGVAEAPRSGPPADTAAFCLGGPRRLRQRPKPTRPSRRAPGQSCRFRAPPKTSIHVWPVWIQRVLPETSAIFPTCIQKVGFGYMYPFWGFWIHLFGGAPKHVSMLCGGGVALRAGVLWGPVSSDPQLLKEPFWGRIEAFRRYVGTIVRHLGLYLAILQAMWTVGGLWKPY